MLEIGVREIRHHLGSFLDKVENGEEIMIIRRGKKIDRLTPMAKTEQFKRIKSPRINGKTSKKTDGDKKKRAVDAVGRFSSGYSDVSIYHDDYLSDFYGKIG